MTSFPRGGVHVCRLDNTPFTEFFLQASYIVSNMSLVKVKVIYDYYATKRVTPIFMTEEVLMSLSYDEFKTHLTTEVPHLEKMGSSLRLTILEDDAEVDLSSSYFTFQIKGLLEKEKNITIKAFVFDSPGLQNTNNASLSAIEKANRNDKSGRGESTARPSRAKRCISLPAPMKEKPLFDDSDDEEDDQAREEPKIMLPLERYAKNKQKAADDIQRLLKTKKQELASCEEKIRLASQQNEENKTATSINLTTCGKCHLKLGHTRKRCNYSPCKTAYSCGNLSKHVSDKLKISNLQREIAKLEGNLSTAQNEIQNAESAVNKVMTSVPKQIEDVIVAELPRRYTTYGQRNWTLLNKDVAILQKNLHGRLPSRENVLQLLHSVVLDSSKSLTDHRMSSQKRLLSNEYGIVFPTGTSRVSSFNEQPTDFLLMSKPNKSGCTFSKQSSSCFPGSAQEEKDFKLAVQLQHEEIDSGDAPQTTQTSSKCFDVDSLNTTNSSEQTDIEFEANAAAALLQLQRKR